MHLDMYLRPEALHPDDLAALGRPKPSVSSSDSTTTSASLGRSCSPRRCTWFLGRPVATQEAAERGLVFASRSRSRREEAWCRGQIGFALMNGPVPVGVGLRRCRDMLVETRGDPVAEANLLLFVALHEAMAGEFTDALDHAAAGRTATRELGLRWQTGIHALLSSQVCLLSGDPVEAETLLRSALATFEENGDAWDVATAELDLQRALYEQGRYDQAREALTRIDRPPWRMPSRTSSGAVFPLSCSRERAASPRQRQSCAGESRWPRRPTSSAGRPTCSWTWARCSSWPVVSTRRPTPSRRQYGGTHARATWSARHERGHGWVPWLPSPASGGQPRHVGDHVVASRDGGQRRLAGRADTLLYGGWHRRPVQHALGVVAGEELDDLRHRAGPAGLV